MHEAIKGRDGVLTFSINRVSASDTYAQLVWTTINSNIGYFKKFNLDRWEEAVHKTYMTALNNRNDSYGDNILPYIKKLARTVLKVQTKESALGVYTEDGEVSPIFSTLKEYINTDSIDGSKELKDAFKEMYLMDSESFMKLKLLYKYNDISDIENVKDIKIRNSELNDYFTRLLVKHGSEFTFLVLYDFFKELPSLLSVRDTALTKEVILKSGNMSVLDRLSDTPTIQDVEGNFYCIDKTTLTMERNPDYFKWDILGKSLCDILKVDISPYMNYMYEEVYVDRGVSTKHIEWCGDKFKLTTPGGKVFIGLDREKYLGVVRVELIVSMMMSNIGSVVAMSPDSVYIKPSRAFQFDTMRIRLSSGKVVDLPITTHIRNRKN